MQPKILAIEDEADIVAALREHLQKWQYEVVAVTDWDNIAAQVAADDFAVILMDITLPKYDGFYWTQQIRRISQVPIIFISARELDPNAVQALLLGADDYLVKPFSLDLLLAKIKVALRRQQPAASNSAPEVLHFGKYQFNALTNEVITATAQLRLTPTEGLILKLLVVNCGTVVHKKQMMQALWAGNNFIDQNALNVNISRLRSKLAQIGAKNVIQTVRNQGYLLEEINA